MRNALLLLAFLANLGSRRRGVLLIAAAVAVIGFLLIDNYEVGYGVLGNIMHGRTRLTSPSPPPIDFVTS